MCVVVAFGVCRQAGVNTLESVSLVGGCILGLHPFSASLTLHEEDESLVLSSLVMNTRMRKLVKFIGQKLCK